MTLDSPTNSEWEDNMFWKNSTKQLLHYSKLSVSQSRRSKTRLLQGMLAQRWLQDTPEN